MEFVATSAALKLVNEIMKTYTTVRGEIRVVIGRVVKSSAEGT